MCQAPYVSWAETRLSQLLHLSHSSSLRNLDSTSWPSAAFSVLDYIYLKALLQDAMDIQDGHYYPSLVTSLRFSGGVTWLKRNTFGSLVVAWDLLFQQGRIKARADRAGVTFFTTFPGGHRVPAPFRTLIPLRLDARIQSAAARWVDRLTGTRTLHLIWSIRKEVPIWCWEYRYAGWGSELWGVGTIASLDSVSPRS